MSRIPELSRDYRVRKVAVFVRLVAILVATLAPPPLFADETTLWSQNFDDATAEGWKYHTHALESRSDMTFTARTTHEGSPHALLGEGGVARVTLRKNLSEAGLSWPIARDTFLTFSYYCRADRSAEDEVVVSIAGADEASGEGNDDGKRFGGSLSIPVRTELNRWRTVTVPLSAFGAVHLGKPLNHSISFAWFRPAADDYAFVLDDVRVTKGTTRSPLLIEPASLRAVPATISPNGDGYDDEVTLRATMLCDAQWEIRIADATGSVVRQFDSKGPRLEQTWDATDADGHTVAPGKYHVDVRPTHPPTGARGRPARSQVMVVAATAAGAGAEDYGVWSVGPLRRPDSAGRRFAIARMITEPPALKLNQPADEIEIELSRNETVGFTLQMSARTRDLANVSIEVDDLVGEHKTRLTSGNIRFNAINYEARPGGYLWMDSVVLPPSFALNKGEARHIEGVVFAPKDLLPGPYEGKIRINVEGSATTQLTLKLKVGEGVTRRSWWQRGPLKIMLAKYQVMPRPEFFENSEKGYQQIADAGFNVMIPYTAYRRHELYSSRAQKYGLTSIARSWILCVGNPETKEPRFVIANGTELPVLCPYSDDRWGTRDVEGDPKMPLHHVKLIGNAKYFARMSLDYPIVAMVIDFELYEVGRPRPSPVYTYCYCNHCMAKFRRFHGVDVPALEPAERYPWLRQRGLLVRYKRFEDDELRRYARMLREEVHKINPQMMFFIFPWEGHFPGLVARELGTEQVPVILGTEHTYGQGGYNEFIEDETAALARNRQICLDQLKQLKMAGIHCLYLPGVMPGYHAWKGGEIPDFCEKNAVTMARYGDGYWVFFQRTGETWQEQRQHDHGVGEYMGAFKRANERIDLGAYTLGDSQREPGAP
jgi:hypothetical protein